MFFSSRRRHTRFKCDWSSDVCSSDLPLAPRPRPSDLSDLRDSPEISSASHTVASKIRMLAARCARSLFLASYFLQQHAISRRKTTRLLSDGARLLSPTAN